MNSRAKTSWKNYRFPIILLLSIVLGSILGGVMGERAVVLKPFGDIFLNMMFTIVVPLVFLTISSAVSAMVDMRRLGKIIGNMFITFVITGLIASVIMIGTVKIFPPAKGVNLELPEAGEIKALETGDQIVAAFTVSDFSEILSKDNMMPLIIFAVFFGICLSLLGEKGESLVKSLSVLSEVFMKMISLLMYYAPIGLGAYFAALVGDFGPQLLSSYARAIAIYYPICIFYFILAFTAYTYYAGGKLGVKTFFQKALPITATSLATQSSIASLPVNLDTAKNIGVPKDIREIILPIGATAHMDGTCLSSILKISFLFGIFGVPFEGISTYITAIAISVIGGVVMSGVPGGGLIGEMLIVNLYGFPMEAFPIIATIGYLVDPPATVINVVGDTVVAMMVTKKIEGRDWMNKKLTEAEELENYQLIDEI